MVEFKRGPITIIVINKFKKSLMTINPVTIGVLFNLI